MIKKNIGKTTQLVREKPILLLVFTSLNRSNKNCYIVANNVKTETTHTFI